MYKIATSLLKVLKYLFTIQIHIYKIQKSPTKVQLIAFNSPINLDCNSISLQLRLWKDEIEFAPKYILKHVKVYFFFPMELNH